MGDTATALLTTSMLTGLLVATLLFVLSLAVNATVPVVLNVTVKT